MNLLKRIGIVLEAIKFEHTIFALPFAFSGAVLAAEGLPTLRQGGWILLAMVGARSSAMAFNRLVDATYDGQNPRTKDRALPRGLLSKRFFIGLILLSSGVFILSAWMLNPLTFALSFPGLAWILFYSYTKRFTALSHLVLGFSLSFAPIGAHIAIKGAIEFLPILLGLGTMFWVAGFDVLYACLDYEFDRKARLFSIPRLFGISKALHVAKGFHALALLFFLLTGIWGGMGTIYFLGTLLVFVFLSVEHAILSPEDLSKINVSFFTMNGMVSIVLFLAILFDTIQK
ncbi:MAG: putative 4-hydroxybenzoate polyprenyltransferase [Desulfobacterota bacterium]|nr:putative 4-hydroxybenzoate polyprenyltransferase [Thermodesulfobacteriota bacterium]